MLLFFLFVGLRRIRHRRLIQRNNRSRPKQAQGNEKFFISCLGACACVCVLVVHTSICLRLRLHLRRSCEPALNPQALDELRLVHTSDANASALNLQRSANIQFANFKIEFLGNQSEYRKSLTHFCSLSPTD